GWVRMPEPSVLVCEDYPDLSRTAADLVAMRIAQKPALNLLAATGNTPMGLYAELVRRRDALDVSRVRVFQLDEYAGVGIEDRRLLGRRRGADARAHRRHAGAARVAGDPAARLRRLEARDRAEGARRRRHARGARVVPPGGGARHSGPRPRGVVW